MAEDAPEQVPGFEAAPGEEPAAVAVEPAPGTAHAHPEHAAAGADAQFAGSDHSNVAAAEQPAAGAADVAASAAARAAALAAQFTAHHSAPAELNSNNKRPLASDGDEPEAKRVYNDDPEDPPGDPAPTYPGAQVSEVVPVPTALIGKLIGKAGATIKEIEMRGHCHLKVNHESKDINVPVTVTGTPEHVALTKRLIDEALEPVAGASGGAAAGHESETVRKITCPVHIVGRIIGRGGETIRSLQTASGAHIMINQNFPEGQPREIEITGTVDSAERAHSMIMEIINTDGSAQPQQLISKYGAGKTMELTCPKHMVGRIIGRGGETVKSLQRQFGAAIQIEQNANPCRVTITGPPAAVTAAERAIMDLIEDRVPGPHGPGGYGGFPPYGGYPPYMGFPQAYGAYGGYGGYPAAYPAYGGYGGGYPGADPYAAAYGGQQQQQQQAGGATGSAGAAGAGAGAAAGGGKVWTEIKDDQGRSYYYNTQTGVSQWEKPSEM